MVSLAGSTLSIGLCKETNMCLTIESVDLDPSVGRIRKCYKTLSKDYSPPYALNKNKGDSLSIIPNWMTPYRYIRVPDDGILLPHENSKKKKFFYGSSIKGRFIHGYYKRPTNYYIGHIFTAYAFRVEAYGDYEDLICRGMYIPNVDITRSRPKIREVKKMLNSNPSTKDLIKEFPRLRRIERFL